MKARVLKDQADLFEMTVFAQLAEITPVGLDELVAVPVGAPLVVVGQILKRERLTELRRVFATLAQAGTKVILAPPFSDLDIGRYFETPVELKAQRRDTESGARILDQTLSERLGHEIQVRSDHAFATALNAGILASDPSGRPVLLRYQATSTRGAIFFSSLQLLSYTALTNESHRQALLAELLAWTSDEDRLAQSTPLKAPNEPEPVPRDVLIPVLLLLTAGGAQPPELIIERSERIFGSALTLEQVETAITALAAEGAVERDRDDGTPVPARLHALTEQLGLHAYTRELADLLAREETIA